MKLRDAVFEKEAGWPEVDALVDRLKVAPWRGLSELAKDALDYGASVVEITEDGRVVGTLIYVPDIEASELFSPEDDG